MRTSARRVPAAVLLLPLGPLAEHNIRTTFAANLLASGRNRGRSTRAVTASSVAEAVGRPRPTSR